MKRRKLYDGGMLSSLTAGASSGAQIGTMFGNPLAGAAVGAVAGGIKYGIDKQATDRMEAERDAKATEVANRAFQDSSRNILSAYPTHGVKGKGLFLADGGLLSSISGGQLLPLSKHSALVVGDKHSEDTNRDGRTGVTMGKDEVEDGEIIFRDNKNQYKVLSKRLGFAAKAKDAKDLKALEGLYDEQEKFKTTKEYTNVANKKAFGGELDVEDIGLDREQFVGGLTSKGVNLAPDLQRFVGDDVSRTTQPLNLTPRTDVNFNRNPLPLVGGMKGKTTSLRTETAPITPTSVPRVESNIDVPASKTSVDFGDFGLARTVGSPLSIDKTTTTPIGRDSRNFNFSTSNLIQAGRFVDNMVNSNLTKNTPEIPNPVLTANRKLNTEINVSPAIEENNNSFRAFSKDINRTVAGGAGISNKQAAFANLLKNKSNILVGKQNAETELKNKEIALNLGIDQNNNSLINATNQAKYGRKVGIQGRVSQNAANFQNDIASIYKDKQMSANEQAALGMIIKTYNTEGVLSRKVYDEIAAQIEDKNSPLLIYLKSKLPK